MFLKVEEIKRYSRNTLPCTVRAIMRVIFKDRLLEEYSYKGIGNKKVFYTLATCSIIFGKFDYLIIIIA